MSRDALDAFLAQFPPETWNVDPTIPDTIFAGDECIACAFTAAAGAAEDEVVDHDAAAVALFMAAPLMVGELRAAAEQFDFYAEQHAAKGTPDADAKAAVNRAMAARMRAAIAAAEGTP